MTAWTKTAPTEPGWYWAKRTVLGKDGEDIVPIYCGSKRITLPEVAYEYGQRIPSAAAIEAAREALQMVVDAFQIEDDEDVYAPWEEKVSAALALLDGGKP